MPATLSALSALIFLLPGFLTDRIIVSLTPQKSRTDIRLVIDSLVWAFVDEVCYRICAQAFGLPLWPMNYVADHPEQILEGHVCSLVCILAISLVIGLVWSCLSIYGIVYGVLRFIKVTRSSGRIDVWQDVLTNSRGSWLRVYLKDGSCIVGWAKHFSDDSECREIFLADAIIERPIQSVPVMECDDGTGLEKTINIETETLEGEGILLTESSDILYIQVLPNQSTENKKDTGHA